jgi:hypothetical protein
MYYELRNSPYHKNNKKDQREEVRANKEDKN